MKNFEKYEKEIKDLLITQNKGTSGLEEIANKKFYHFYEAIIWLYEDYKEPLLTDEEKEYLRVVIEPFKESVYNICLRKEPHDCYLQIYRDSHYCLAIIHVNSDMFKNMEIGKYYTLKDLGLEEE